MSIINVSNPTLAAVQAGINVAVDGDTVVVPAGSATWSSTLNMNKAIDLIANGTGGTVIQTPTDSVGILVAVDQPKRYSISGFELHGPASEGFSFQWAPYVIKTSGSCRQARIHDNKFVMNGSGGGYLVGLGDIEDLLHQYGVLYNNEFVNGKILVLGGGLGDQSWKDETDLGGPTAWYIEDNTFDQANGAFNNAVDCQYGARYVFRHNDVKDAFLMVHPCANGDTSYFGRGPRKFEIYENTIRAVLTSTNHWVAISPAAGTGVIYNNTVTNGAGTNGYDYLIGMEFSRAYEAGGGALGKAPNSAIDGMQESNGYPCIDQPGRGKDAGGTAQKYPPYSRVYHPQALEPIYAWGNKMDGVVNPVSVINSCGAWIKKNRDYYNSAKPGYVPYTYPHPLRSGDEPMATSHTLPIVLTITAAPAVPDFTPSANPGTVSVIKGTSAVYNIGVAAVAGTGWTSNVTLSVSGLPTGAVATFSVNPVAPGGSSVLTITTTAAAVGTYNLTVTYTGVNQ